MFTKAFVLVAGATSAYAACGLSPAAGSINLPGNSVVSPDGTDSRTPTKGVPFTIMYDGTGLGPTLNFVLLKGPGNNIIPQGYIANSVANCGTASCTLSWTPDCSIEDTGSLYNGYGIRMDDESTCNYQYTTQFGIKAGNVCGNKPSSVAPPPASSEAPKPSGSGAPQPPKPSDTYPSGSHPSPPKPSGDSGKPDTGKPGSGMPGSGSGMPGSGSGGYGGSTSGSSSGSSSWSSSGSSSWSSSGSAGSSGSGGYSGSWSPPSNGTSYQPATGSSNSTKPTYTPVYSNNASGQFAVNAVGAIVALAASFMLL